MENSIVELEFKIRTYVLDRYRPFIEGETIFYRNAIIPIEMLVKESAGVSLENPDKDLYFVVDLMFEYFYT